MFSYNFPDSPRKILRQRVQHREHSMIFIESVLSILLPQDVHVKSLFNNYMYNLFYFEGVCGYVAEQRGRQGTTYIIDLLVSLSLGPNPNAKYLLN